MEPYLHSVRLAQIQRLGDSSSLRRHTFRPRQQTRSTLSLEAFLTELDGTEIRTRTRRQFAPNDFDKRRC